MHSDERPQGQEHPGGDPVDLAALYVSGAMTGDELRAFAAHLAAGCELCDREVRALDAVVASLTNLATPVSPSELSRLITLATASHILGEPSPEQAGLIGELIAMVEKSLPQLLKAAQSWQLLEIPGLAMYPLEIDRQSNRITALLHGEPGTQVPPHVHEQAEQFVVLHGDLRVGSECLGPGEYRYWQPGEQQPAQCTSGGCLLLVSSPLDLAHGRGR